MDLYVFGRLKLVDAFECGRLVKLSIMWHGILCLGFIFWQSLRKAVCFLFCVFASFLLYSEEILFILNEN